MKNMVINIKQEDLRMGEKTRRRNEMIELGIYGIHSNKVFKSKKAYSRKGYKVEY